STNRRHLGSVVVGGGVPSTGHTYAFITCSPPSPAQRTGRLPCAVCEQASPFRRYSGRRALSLLPSRRSASTPAIDHNRIYAEIPDLDRRPIRRATKAAASPARRRLARDVCAGRPIDRAC